MNQIHIENLNPLFVMGCQRSGTTMLASQLGAPRNAIALPELPFIIGLLKAELKENTVNQAFNSLINHRKFHTLEIEIKFEEFEASWECKRAKGIIELIINKYLTAKNEELPKLDAYNWIEHCPTNIDNFYLLKRFFPKAKFIHIVRDPRAVYASMKHLTRWNVSEPIKLSMTWIRTVSKGYLLKTKYPDSIAQITYEEYVKDSSVLIGLCEFLEIEFSEDMRNGGGVILPKFTQKQHKLTMGKASTTKLSSWKNKISVKEDDAIKFFCHEWMVEFEYSAKDYLTDEPSARDKRIWRLKSFFLDTRAKIVNKLVLKGIIRVT